MSKTIKRLILIAGITVLLVGGLAGGLVIYRNASRKNVDVYPIADFIMPADQTDMTECYGEVRTDKIQKIMVSETQTVTDVFVSVGDSVKTGDQILAYDTTLTDIDLQKAENALKKSRYSLDQAQYELERLKQMGPHYSYLVTPPQQGITYTPHSTMTYISGAGTAEDPIYVLYQDGDAVNQAFIQNMLAKKAEAAAEAEAEKQQEIAEPGDDESTSDEGAEGSETSGEVEPDGDEEADDAAAGETAGDESAEDDPSGDDTPDEPAVVPEAGVYIAFVTRVYNALNAPIIGSWGIFADLNDQGMVFSYYDPVLSEEILSFEAEEEPYYVDGGSGYTQAELEEMRKQKAQEITDLELTIKMQQVELDRLQEEKNDGIVTAKVDGVIKEIRDPDICALSGEPVVEISGGGGYLIEVAMGEFDLGRLKIGDTVNVNSWETGECCEGTVVEVSNYPTRNADSWSQGNTNVSYYPFTVFVTEDHQLMEYSYVNITYSTASTADGSFYLENMFIRSEGGKNYVFVEGADGLLEKRFITTGKDLWGSYTLIRDGLTAGDQIAFPYGKETVEGAGTVRKESQELYNKEYLG